MMKKAIFLMIFGLLGLKAAPQEQSMYQPSEYLYETLKLLKSASIEQYLDYDAGVKIDFSAGTMTFDKIKRLRLFEYGEENLQSRLANKVIGLFLEKGLYPYNSVLHLAMQNTSPTLLKFLCSDAYVEAQPENALQISPNVKKNKPDLYAYFKEKKGLKYAYLLAKNAYGEHALHCIPSLRLQTDDFDTQLNWQKHKKEFYEAVHTYLFLLKKKKAYLFDVGEHSWEAFVDASDRNGKTILDKAVEHKDATLVALYKRFDIQFKNKDILFEHLKNSILNKEHKMLQVLLSYADKALLAQPVQTGLWDRSQSSLLHYAALQKNSKAIEALIQ